MRSTSMTRRAFLRGALLFSAVAALPSWLIRPRAAHAQTSVGTRLTIPAGDTIFGPIQLPSSVSQLTLTLDRNAWPDRGATVDIIQWSIELSDDQITWVPQVLGTAGGGVKPKPTSQTAFFNTPVAAGTWVRAVVTATEPLDTKAMVTWL